MIPSSDCRPWPSDRPGPAGDRGDHHAVTPRPGTRPNRAPDAFSPAIHRLGARHNCGHGSAPRAIVATASKASAAARFLNDRSSPVLKDSLSVEIFPIFREPSASAEPCKCALHNPSFRQDDEALCLIRALDDLHVHPRHDFFDGATEQRALIAAVGVELKYERIQAEHRRHDQFAAVAILNVGGVHDGVDQQALRVDEDVTLLALDLFASVIPRRIDRSPPFSALLTLWESLTAAVGLASRPIASRHFT